MFDSEKHCAALFILTLMITNTQRSELFKKMRAPQRTKESLLVVEDLLRHVEEERLRKTTPNEILCKCFQLVSFASVFPSHEYTNEVVNTIALIVSDLVTIEEKCFVVNKLFKKCASAQGRENWRFVLTESDKERAEDLYKKFKTEPKRSSEILHVGYRLLERVRAGDSILPEYFVRDLRLVITICEEDLKRVTFAESANAGWAALDYLALEDDAVSDSLGYIGIVDDMFIMHLAARELLTTLESMQKVVDSTYSRFPYLHELRFHQTGNYGHQVSDYFLLVCLPLFDSLQRSQSAIKNISIVAQPTLHSISAGLVLAFAVLAEYVSREPGRKRYEDLSSLESLTVGQEVTLREQGTKWIFTGITKVEGSEQEHLRLEGIGRNKGVVYAAPLSTPMLAKGARRARERVGGSYQLNATEMMFDLDKFDHSQYRANKRIFLICNRNRYEKALEGIHCNGVTWKKSLPTAAIPAGKGTDFDEKVEIFSGETIDSVVLFVVPNVRTLIDYHYSGHVS